MEPVRERLRIVTVRSGTEEYLLTVDREDFSTLYPRMIRYVLAVSAGDRRVAVFHTNTFEYPPLSPLAAETVAQERAAAWESEFARDPAAIIREYPDKPMHLPPKPTAGLVLIQGSPLRTATAGSWPAGQRTRRRKPIGAFRSSTRTTSTSTAVSDVISATTPAPVYLAMI